MWNGGWVVSDGFGPGRAEGSVRRGSSTVRSVKPSAGLIRGCVEAEYPLEQVNEALARLADGNVTGRLVITPFGELAHAETRPRGLGLDSDAAPGR